MASSYCCLPTKCNTSTYSCLSWLAVEKSWALRIEGQASNKVIVRAYARTFTFNMRSILPLKRRVCSCSGSSRKSRGQLLLLASAAATLLQQQIIYNSWSMIFLAPNRSAYRLSGPAPAEKRHIQPYTTMYKIKHRMKYSRYFQ